MKRTYRKISAALAVCIMLFWTVPENISAAETGAADVIGQVKEKLSAVFEEVDEETANEFFSFLKEQVQEGNLNSKEGVQSAIKEGEDKFGVAISEENARELVSTMEKLEDMGFSAEYVIDKSQSLYQEYGADFVDHVDEVVTGAVKNAASNAVGGFFTNLKNSIKSFFSNLFS